MQNTPRTSALSLRYNSTACLRYNTLTSSMQYFLSALIREICGNYYSKCKSLRVPLRLLRESLRYNSTACLLYSSPNFTLQYFLSALIREISGLLLLCAFFAKLCVITQQLVCVNPRDLREKSPQKPPP